MSVKTTAPVAPESVTVSGVRIEEFLETERQRKKDRHYHLEGSHRLEAKNELSTVINQLSSS